MRVVADRQGVRTLGILEGSTVFETCELVFSSSHRRQICKKTWLFSVTVRHALSALSGKTSSWPRHGWAPCKYYNLLRMARRKVS